VAIVVAGKVTDVADAVALNHVRVYNGSSGGRRFQIGMDAGIFIVARTIDGNDVVSLGVGARARARARAVLVLVHIVRVGIGKVRFFRRFGFLLILQFDVHFPAVAFVAAAAAVKVGGRGRRIADGMGVTAVGPFGKIVEHRVHGLQKIWCHLACERASDRVMLNFVGSCDSMR